jgi:hypothetical protein
VTLVVYAELVVEITSFTVIVVVRVPPCIPSSFHIKKV